MAAVLIGASLLGVTGCATGSTAQIVATVGHSAITKSAFEHWLGVVAVRDYQLKPSQPVPSWVLPDPPPYSNCVSHLTATPSGTAGGPSAEQAKKQCSQRYQALREQTLDFLITGAWMISEGEARGLHVTVGEARHRFEDRVLKNEFAGRSEFDRVRALTGETVADQLFRARIKLSTELIEHQFLDASGLDARQRQVEFGRWSQAFPKRWSQRTDCKPGYVVSNCREYKGPNAAQIVL